MGNLNKAMIIGNCGRDADLRYTNSGTAVSDFSVAVNSNRRNKETNEWDTETEWFNVVLFGDQAERVSQHITKGKQVYVEGRLRTRNWDDEQGIRHYRTELIGNTVQFLDRRGDSNGHGPSAEALAGEEPAPTGAQPAASAPSNDDPLPFE